MTYCTTRRYVHNAALILLLFTTATAVKPIVNPIVDGKKTLVIRKYAQLPMYQGNPAKITCVASLGKTLYAVSSLTGLIYKVPPNGKVSLWFNATAALEKKGRKLHTSSNIFSGVRSIAFHPTFFKTGLFYISALEYRLKNEKKSWFVSLPPKVASRAEADSVVTEFKYNFKTKKVDDWSLRQVLRVGLPRIDHPIRQIIFQWKFLIIMHGDGSHGYDSFKTKDIVGGGQNNDALGKMLRINPLKSGSKPYTIPASNPFVKNKKYIPEIYALGFRNPHNVCFSKTQGLYVADVGRHNVEEINIVKSGHNYGWAKREGTFVHLQPGGTDSGITKLPKDDKKYGFTYPAAMYGHDAEMGQKGSGTSIAGACPIDNGSPLDGLYLYCNFGTRGDMYYSFVNEMKKAVTQGDPEDLTQAKTYRAKLLWDHDEKPSTPLKKVVNFQQLLSLELKASNLKRTDLRFGVAADGTTYVSSKANGGIYVIANSIPKKK